MNNNFNNNELLVYNDLDLNTFISRKEARNIMTKVSNTYQFKVSELEDKLLFLQKFKKLGLVKRKYYSTDKPIPQLLQRIYIIKPIHGSWGRGVKAWLPFIKPNKYSIIEDRIKNIYDLRKFNIFTLNTIRIITIRHNDNVEVFGALFRCGNGYNSVVDNAHKGGLFAEINVETGTVISDFVDIKGNNYSIHPYSQLQIKGFQIPLWDEVIEKSKFAALNTENPITGWDIAITENNDIEFIEGNSRPDFDMLQIPTKTGCKQRFIETIKRMFNIDF